MQTNNKLSFIAKTIIEQMGGMGKLVAMIGAWNFQEEKKPDGISFRFKGSKIANHVKITLVSDLYIVQFSLISAKDGLCREGEKYEGVYDTMLKGIFEDYTKLYLSL
ncbi:hypothetical protein CAL7716_102360 (plasmid) [Calothrix sp. PCC 7716]|nr:hypothetical protein CAL7716_102360 [Calothrix sp. PCC 7716]